MYKHGCRLFCSADLYKLLVLLHPHLQWLWRDVCIYLLTYLLTELCAPTTALTHTVVKCFSRFLWQHHPHWNSKLLSTTRQTTDNIPCYRCSPSFSYSLINHNLLRLFSAFSSLTPQGPSLFSTPPEFYKTIPWFPALPLSCPSSSGSISSGDHIWHRSKVWPPIAMTTCSKHLRSQTRSRFSQPRSLLLHDVIYCHCVACTYVCVHTCWGGRSWNWHYSVLDTYRDIAALT